MLKRCKLHFICYIVIGFLDIVKTIKKIFKDKDFKKYATRHPKTIKDIVITDNWARLKTNNMCVR